MSLEALWTVRFGAPHLADHELEGGVAVIETGRILGGDSGYAYVGNVEVSGDQVSGKLRSMRHNAAIGSVFGLDEDELDLTFDGKRVSHDRIEGAIHREGFQPGRFVFTRLAELP